MNVLLWISVAVVQCVIAKIDNNQTDAEVYGNGLEGLKSQEWRTEPWTNALYPSLPDSIETKLDDFVATDPTQSGTDSSQAKRTVDLASTSSTVDLTQSGTIQDSADSSSTQDSESSTAEKSTQSSTTEDSTQSTSSSFSTSTTDQSSTIAISTTTSGSTANPCFPIPEIQILNINRSSFYATFEWTLSDSSDCQYVYLIHLNNAVINRTQDLKYEIHDLNACTEYTLGIQASMTEDNLGPITNETITTPAPDDLSTFGVIVKLIPNQNSLSITWEIAEEIGRCVTAYNLTWSIEDDSASEHLLNASTTNYELTPIISCAMYNIKVTPIINNISGETSEEEYEADGTPNSPVYENVETGKTDISITWTVDNRTLNKCPRTDIIVTCIAPDEMNSNDSWIIRYKSQEFNISDANDFSVTTVITELSPFTNYTCSGLVVNSHGNSSSTSFDNTTQEDVPSQPRSLTIEAVGSKGFTIKWSEPEKIPARNIEYGVLILDNGPQQQLIICPDTNNSSATISTNDTNVEYAEGKPFHNYQIYVYGITIANGASVNASVTTGTSEPDPATNGSVTDMTYSQTETYHLTATVTFIPPCDVNGPFKHYTLQYTGIRNGFNNDSQSIDFNSTSVEVELKPERNYWFEIVVVTDSKSDPLQIPSIQTRAGVPQVVETLKAPTVFDTTKAKFELSIDSFSNENGEIVAFALFLATQKGNGTDYGFWSGANDSWPPNPDACQLTQQFWNPFVSGTTTIVYYLDTSSYCKQPLNEDTTYWLQVRALTSAAYKDSWLQFKTDMSSANLALILGLIFGLLTAITLGAFVVYLWWRKRRYGVQVDEKRPSTSSPQSVSCDKFLSYYLSIKEDSSIVKAQFDELGVRSKELDMTVSYANLPENKRKNRYTNILPYDATRVTLKIDEDDEICSDYINASFIKGYSGRVEYVATQGPLESTTRDFWKMIMQENVSIIVMVSQFVEQNKEKCSQYFPNNHGSLTFGESLEVKCTTELHFGTYCIRTLQVRKGSDQRFVTHMQFLEWPDFGVPQGTDNMLQFIRQIREKVNAEGGLIAVHCSAGVGRTGTLIALDILLQTIDRNEDINIYNTVFNLRKQRTNMVQTDKQYMFIHTSVKEYIETPVIQSPDTTEDHIYENMSVIRSSMKKNLIESQVESAL